MEEPVGVGVGAIEGDALGASDEEALGAFDPPFSTRRAGACEGARAIAVGFACEGKETSFPRV